MENILEFMREKVNYLEGLTENNKSAKTATAEDFSIDGSTSELKDKGGSLKTFYEIYSSLQFYPVPNQQGTVNGWGTGLLSNKEPFAVESLDVCIKGLVFKAIRNHLLLKFVLYKTLKQRIYNV